MKRLLFSLIPFLLLSSVFADEPDQTKDLALERSNEHTLAAVYNLNTLDQDLDLYIGSAEDCHEVQICSIDESKVNGDKFEATECKGDKVIFRPIENTVKVGSKTKFFGRPVARFTAKGKGKYKLSAQSDFDGYLSEKNGDWKTTLDVSFTKFVLVMSSGLSCPTRLRAMNYGFSNQKVLITEMSMTKPRAAVMSHLKKVPAVKGSILKIKESQPADCCYNGYVNFDNLVDDSSWGKSVNSISWQRYNMTFQQKEKVTNPLWSFALKIEEKYCRWVRVCFDDYRMGLNDLCDSTSVDLLFEAGVFIPSDTEQATPFIAQEGTTDLTHFVFEVGKSNVESYLILKYGQVDERDDWFAVEHKMIARHMLNTTLTVSLATPPNCRAGLVRHMGNIGLNVPNVERTVGHRQSVHIRNCECFTKKDPK